MLNIQKGMKNWSNLNFTGFCSVIFSVVLLHMSTSTVATSLFVVTFYSWISLGFGL